MMKRSALYLATGLLCLLAADDAFAQKKYDAGVTDTEIKIGQNAPFSGPASSYSILSRVQSAYLKAINDRGGINGRKITLLSRDDAYSPSKTLEVIRQLVEDDQVLAIVSPFGTPTNAAIQKYLNIRKVPQLLVQSGASRWNSPKSFPWTTPYSPFYDTEGENFANYILKNKPSAKIAVLYQADDIGRDYLKGLREGLGEKAAAMIVKEASYQTTDPTIDSQILILKASGADVVFLAAQNKFTAQAIRRIHELGWKPQLLLTSIANSVSGVLVPAGLEASTGAITTTIYKVPDDPAWADDKGMKDYLSFMREHLAGSNPNDITAITGYAAIEIAVEILRRCGDDLTRANVLKQATNLKGLKVSMLINGITIQTTPENYAAVEQTRFAKFDGKNWVLFGDLVAKTQSISKR
jgi:ABC-type branched-subunit amino acid transport system substrate-binding protein